MLLQNRIRRFTTEKPEIDLKVKVGNLVPFLLLFLLLASATKTFGQANTTVLVPQIKTPPKTWIDADTGHRVTRLTDEPNSEAPPSSRNAFTPDGRDMIYTSPEAIRVLNLATLRSKLLIVGKVHNVVVGTKTRRVFFTKESAFLYAVDIDTRQVKRIAPIPPLAVITSVNADETLLLGTRIEPGAPEFNDFLGKAWKDAAGETMKNPAGIRSSKEIGEEVKEQAKKMRIEAKVPEYMFTVNLQTGEVRTILQGTDWLNKVQFSPTDTDLILYEHEGPYTNAEIEHIWTIRSDGSQNLMVHQRVTPEEIATRQFWSRDGKTIWYELQKPIPDKPTWTDHVLVGYDVATGKGRYFHLDQLQYSVFYGSGNGDGLFCGSGH